MALIIVGLLVLIAGVVIARNEGPVQRMAGAVKLGGIDIMLRGGIHGFYCSD